MQWGSIKANVHNDGYLELRRHQLNTLHQFRERASGFCHLLLVLQHLGHLGPYSVVGGVLGMIG